MGQEEENALEQKPRTDHSPRFGRLLLVCFAAISFCGALVWIADTYLSDCCTFPGLNRFFR